MGPHTKMRYIPLPYPPLSLIALPNCCNAITERSSCNAWTDEKYGLDSEKSEKFFNKVLNVKSVSLFFLFLVVPFSHSFYQPVWQGFSIDYAIIFLISFL
jgi:hypothetical protein